MKQLRKVLRFIQIYGLGRTWFKIAGRLRIGANLFKFNPFLSARKNIGIIGCGQFAFATIGYFIQSQLGRRFGDCYDIDSAAKSSFAHFYGVRSPAVTVEKLINNPALELVYIASNHFSHTDYAINCLENGKRVYLEKPISVTGDQLVRLVRAIRASKDDQIFFGYNRPFSGVIQDLRCLLGVRTSPITLNCFISGHKLDPDHWYRKPDEGTRICGNVGHWLDLSVHILSWGRVSDHWKIQLTYSDLEARDDDMAIALTSLEGDLINIVLTARCEPFEGINESINLQHDTTICKIDDFRSMTVWQNEKVIKKHYWPKDVGHRGAILQPFQNGMRRDIDEVVNSTMLMLHIAEMVKAGENASSFSFKESRHYLDL